MSTEQKSDPKDQKKVDLDTLLAELGGGIRLTVHRLEPLWCDGYLGTIEVDEDDTISMENLRELFGGRKLKCKVIDGSGNIIAVRTAKFPDNPRKDGIELKQPDPNDEKKNGGGGQSELMSMFLKSQETMVEMAREHTAAIEKLVTDKLQGQASPSSPSTAIVGTQPLKEAMELVDWIENLKDRVKDNSQEVNPLHKQMLGMAEKFFSYQLEKDQMIMEHELERSAAPDLPERSNSRRVNPDAIDDMTLLRTAAERFQGLPLEQQKAAAEMFFKMNGTDHGSSGPIEENELDSDGTQINQPAATGGTAATVEAATVGAATGHVETDPDLVLDPDDEAELRAAETEGEIPTS